MYPIVFTLPKIVPNKSVSALFKFHIQFTLGYLRLPSLSCTLQSLTVFKLLHVFVKSSSDLHQNLLYD